MRKRKHEEHENLERWLVSYADFITLLFAFFTVLYATSVSDKAKMQEVAESIQRAFLSSGGLFPLKSVPMISPFENEPVRKSETPSKDLQTAPFSKADQGMLEKIQENLEGLFEKTTGLALKHGDLEVYRSEQGFKIRLNEALLYRGTSDKIRKEHIPFLYEVGGRLGRLGVKIQVEGHSDNIEPLGPVSNWQLSLNRSYNVVRFLVEASKFPKDKASVAGFGDTRPISPNDSSEGRARNRRVEISVISDTPVSELPW